MAVFLSPVGNDAPFMNPAGEPYVGAKLFFYVAGSVGTKQNTYTDNTGGVANTNPVILDAGGFPTGNVEIWMTGGEFYKIVLAPATDTDPPTSPIKEWDYISGVNDATVSIDQWVAGPAPTFVSGTSFTLVGDQTTVFHPGRRLLTINTSGTVYSYIVSSTFGAVTTVTVVNDSGALDSGLSAVSYGLLSAINPSTPLLADTFPLVSGSADATKKVRLEVDGLTIGTTRTLTVQDADGSLSLTSEFAYTGLPSTAGRLLFPAGHLWSGTISNNAGDATNDIDVAAGQACDSTGAVNIIWAALIKQLDAAWAAGTNAGMRDAGSIADGTWHIFAIKKDSDGTGDILASTSATAPTMPAGYTYFRRIGSIIRITTILAFTQVGDDFYLTTAVSNSTSNPGTTDTPFTLTVPTGIRVKPYFHINTAGVSNTMAMSIRIPDIGPTEAPSNSDANANWGITANGTNVTRFNVSQHLLYTNTSGQINLDLSATSSAAFEVKSYGWQDSRGRFG